MFTSISEEWIIASLLISLINGYLGSTHSNNKLHRQLLFIIDTMSMMVAMIIAGSINIKYFGFINSIIIILGVSVITNGCSALVRKELADPPAKVKENSKNE